MDRFVIRQNVTNFCNELKNGAEDARRVTLLRLLVEEENPPVLAYEVHDEMIDEIKKIILAQLETIALLKFNGHPMEKAEIRLSDLADLLVAHETHGQNVKDGLWPSGQRGSVGERQSRRISGQGG